MADRAAGHTRLLDLVCGPPGPVPDTGARYRLVEHLATGGQAEVYRAVRLSSGVSSAPVTVKVFRGADDRPVADQLRLWDMGDAVLMDLNSRGVGGICRRADGFYGPPPHPPGTAAPAASVPYQVLDYLHGVNLRDYIRQRRGVGQQGTPRVDALVVLRELATTLRALHRPGAGNTSPVLHLDIKPSNVMVLDGGGVRLIDFTAARYHRREPNPPVSPATGGGPEAFTGLVGPAYDVYGFGAVAYYLVTGVFPRTDRAVDIPSPVDGVAPPPWAVLRRHPMLDAHPELRDHLQAALADQPGDRPATAELPVWVNRLADLVRRASVLDVGVSWTGEPARWQASPAVPPVAAAEPADMESATVKILPPAARNATSAVPATQAFAGVPDTLREPAAGGRPPMRGVASVRQRDPDPTLDHAPDYDSSAYDHHDGRREYAPGERLSVLRRGGEFSAAGGLFAFVCWGIWAFSSREAAFGGLAATFVFVLAVAVGVFALCRMAGRPIWSRMVRRPRRTARPSHIVTAVYLGAAGVGFLQQTPWVMGLVSWFRAAM